MKLGRILIFFLLLFTAFFSPVLIPQKILSPGDGLSYYLPNFFSPFTLWEPLLMGGYPIFADPQAATFYPVSILVRAFGSYNFFIILAYVLGSSFLYAYVYSVTKSRFAGLTAGITYGLSGFMITRLAQASVVHAAAWAPLVIWSLEEIRVRSSWKFFVIGSIGTACCILGGHPQIYTYGLALAIAYLAIMGWFSASSKIKFYAQGIGMIGLGLCLSAIQLIPSLELANQSVRVKLSYTDFVSYSLPPKQIVHLLFPYLFGGSAPSFYGMDYFGDWNQYELAGYVGLLPLMLTCIALVRSERRLLAWFWFMVSVASFLSILGDATPMAKYLFHLPVFNKFRAQGRHFFEFTLAISIMAGLGFATIESRRASKRLIVSLVLASVAVLFMALSGIIYYANDLESLAFTRLGIDVQLVKLTNPALFTPLIIFFLAVIILVFSSLKPLSVLRTSLLIVMLVIDLGSYGWVEFAWRYCSIDKSQLQPSLSVVSLRELLDESNQRILPTQGVKDLFIPPNLSRLWYVSSASIYDPLILSRVSSLLDMTYWGEIADACTAEANRSLDIMSVRFISSPHQDIFLGSRRWSRVRDITNAAVFENLHALPRAWLVPTVQTLHPDEILQAIKTSRLPDGSWFDPTQLALVEDSMTFESQGHSITSELLLLKNTETALDIKTKTASPGFLILADTFYPGWKATIDGRETSIYRTNYVQRGVIVPEGEHLVRFVFNSPTLNTGLIFSLSALIILLAGVMSGWRRQSSPNAKLNRHKESTARSGLDKLFKGLAARFTALRQSD